MIAQLLLIAPCLLLAAPTNDASVLFEDSFDGTKCMRMGFSLEPMGPLGSLSHPRNATLERATSKSNDRFMMSWTRIQ